MDFHVYIIYICSTDWWASTVAVLSKTFCTHANLPVHTQDLIKTFKGYIYIIINIDKKYVIYIFIINYVHALTVYLTSILIIKSYHVLAQVHDKGPVPEWPPSPEHSATVISNSYFTLTTQSFDLTLSQNDHLYLNTVQQSFTTQSFYLDNNHWTWHCPRMTTFTWTQYNSPLQHSHWTWHCPKMILWLYELENWAKER